MDISTFMVFTLYRIGSTFGGPNFCELDVAPGLPNQNGYIVPASPISSTTSLGSMEIQDTPNGHVHHPFQFSLPPPQHLDETDEPIKTPTINNINNNQNEPDMLANHTGYFGSNKVGGK